MTIIKRKCGFTQETWQMNWERSTTLRELKYKNSMGKWFPIEELSKMHVRFSTFSMMPELINVLITIANNISSELASTSED